MRRKIITAIFLLPVFLLYFLYICPNLSKSNIDSITLSYKDKEKEASLPAYMEIEVDKKYWNRIIKTIKKAKYELPNLLGPFGPMYKIIEPEYIINIKYKYRYETYIRIWEGLLKINFSWYEVTDKSKEIFNIIEEIIESSSSQ